MEVAGGKCNGRVRERSVFSVVLLTICCLFAVELAVRLLISAAYMRQGWGFTLDKAFKQAYRSYSRADKFNWSYARESFYQGLARVELGDIRGSLRFFEHEIEEDPYYHDTYDTCSAVMGMLGRPADAESYARRALSLNPMSLQGHVNLGVALLRQGRREEAAATFRAALQIDPSCTDAIGGLAASSGPSP